MNKIIVSTQLSLKDYRQLSLALLYKNKAIKFITGLGIFFLSITLFTALISLFKNIEITGIILGLVFIGALPLVTYISSKKNYNSDQRISEKITYEFDKDTISIKAQSFNTTMTWEKTHQVSESKNFILIWQNKQAVSAIPKSAFTGEQLKEFRLIVQGLTGPKNKLKE